VVDRVNTTMAVWMGTTAACAQCHDHKHDPISPREFYQLFAFFDQTADADRPDEAPVRRLPAARDRFAIQELQARRNRCVVERQRLLEVRANQNPAAESLAEAIARLDAELDRLAGPPTPILQELPADQRRTTRIHRRGSFLNQGEAVAPATPRVFPPLHPDQPPNRLGLARWLVDPCNPLTSRVLVNRFWAQLFGNGLVATSEDFGTRGELPSHPQVLDWLASEFVANGHSTKALLRCLVTSATYRQDANGTEHERQRDPQNRLLARGPRLRLPAEAVRDQALAVSGLLSAKMLGPSVMPPQPEGLWQVVYSDDQWRTSSGEDRLRRGLYTFLRRTHPYPAMETFDAPSREVCVVRRLLTNTPLQALVTLNDPVFVEAAQALARQALAELATDRQRIAWLFEQCLCRPPHPAETTRLLQLVDAQRRSPGADVEALAKLESEALGPLPVEADPQEHAVWIVVAQVVLNLDEFLTKG
jgi:hypothetical protein